MCYVLFVRKYICSLKQPFVKIIFPLQTANVAYFQRKIKFSGFSAYPDGSPAVPVNLDKWRSTVLQLSLRD